MFRPWGEFMESWWRKQPPAPSFWRNGCLSEVLGESWKRLGLRKCENSSVRLFLFACTGIKTRNCDSGFFFLSRKDIGQSCSPMQVSICSRYESRLRGSRVVYGRLQVCLYLKHLSFCSLYHLPIPLLSLNVKMILYVGNYGADWFYHSEHLRGVNCTGTCRRNDIVLENGLFSSRV